MSIGFGIGKYKNNARKSAPGKRQKESKATVGAGALLLKKEKQISVFSKGANQSAKL